MQKCIIHNALNIRVKRPCYDMRLPRQKLFLDLCCHSLKVPTEVKLSSKEHFLRLMNVSLIGKALHIDSNKCQRECLLSCFSITITMHFADTLRQFLTFQFFDNNRHNCYRLQQYIWRLWDRKIRLFLRTSDTNQTSLFVTRSSK